MRKLAIVAVGLSLFGLVSAAAGAEVIDFTPFAGYTTVTMGSMNGDQQSLTTIFKILGAEGGSVQSTDLSNAWIVGGDLLTDRLTPWKRLSLGLRGEYLETNPSTDDYSHAGMTIDYTGKGSLTGVLLGGRYQLPGAEYGLNLSVGAFGGLGYGTMAQDIKLIEGETLNDSSLSTGEGFMADLDLRLDWIVPHVQWLHLDAQGGYRYASFGEFSEHGKPMDGPGGMLSAFAPIYPDGPVNVDFSGLTAEGGLTVVF